MNPILLVVMGGALGSLGRFGVGLLCAKLFGADYPWGTLSVNIIGGFAMGMVFAYFADNRPMTLLLATGVLGGFTTFSAFSLETVRMIERGAIPLALGYVAASVVFACMAVWAGLSVGRALQ